MLQPFYFPLLDIFRSAVIVDVFRFNCSDIYHSVALGWKNGIIADLDFMGETIQHTGAYGIYFLLASG